MNILILGAAGFIGTNIVLRLSADKRNTLTLVDKEMCFFESINKLDLKNIKIRTSSFDNKTDFDSLLSDQDVVYHLVSTNVPTTSNKKVYDDIQANVSFSAELFEACVRNNVKRVVFISSGGTVYGKESNCPLSESTATNPISSYGLQKVTIEKMLYLYSYMYGLDYRIIRLANPYGPFQRPNGILGAVTTFTYKALKGEEITVYGDGSVIRDFIYIDDAVRAIENISQENTKHHIYNLGCGHGTSIRQVLDAVSETLGCEMNISWKAGRGVDVPVNYLDISRYENEFGLLDPLSLHEGIRKTAEYMQNYHIV